MSFDPPISEWGNPVHFEVHYRAVTPLGARPGELKHLSTRRKRKIVSIPSVAASESGGAQTGRKTGVADRGMGLGDGIRKGMGIRP